MPQAPQEGEGTARLQASRCSAGSKVLDPGEVPSCQTRSNATSSERSSLLAGGPAPHRRDGLVGWRSRVCWNVLGETWIWLAFFAEDWQMSTIFCDGEGPVDAGRDI